MPQAQPSKETGSTSSMSVEEAIRKAIAHHQDGELAAAEQLYRAILAAVPGHADAHHNLGVLAVQVGQPETALADFKAALNANPSCAQYWLSIIDALLRLGRTDEAGKLLQEATAHGLPPEVHGHLVATMTQHKVREGPGGQTAETAARPASQGLDVAVGQPDREALLRAFTDGNIAELERLALAQTRAVPRDAFAWMALGLALNQKGEAREAIDALRQAIELDPGNAATHYNLARVLHELGRYEEAADGFREAIRMHEGFIEAHYNLGKTLYDLGKHEEA